MDETNHHLHKPVFIGEIKADGQFNVVWKTKGPIRAQPWSPFIAGNDEQEGRPGRQVIAAAVSRNQRGLRPPFLLTHRIGRLCLRNSSYSRFRFAP